MAFEELDAEAEEILNSIVPVTDAGLGDEDEDEILIEAEEDKTKPKPGETPEGFVPKSEFDRISAQVDAVTRALAARDAAAPAPAAPAFVPAAPPAGADPAQVEAFKAKFAEQLFADPFGTIQQVLAANNNSTRAAVEQATIETTATVGRQMVSSLRDRFAAEYPEYKSVLPQMDKLLEETKPEVLAGLVKTGKLADVYEENFLARAGRIAIKVNREAKTRRTTAATAPDLSGMGRGGVREGARGTVTPIRTSGKQIRMSDLSPEDREAVIQGRRFGLSAAEVLAQEA